MPMDSVHNDLPSTRLADTVPLAPSDSLSPRAEPSSKKNDQLRTPAPASTLSDVAIESASDSTPALGRYLLLGELGEGGMGLVYRARDRTLDRIVALKVIRGGSLIRREELDRFLLEAKAAAQFDHPHIVPILEIGSHLGQPYYTMPYLAGGNLAQNLDRLQGDVEQAVTLIRKVAQALDCVHQKGILHRDLKLANVLLDETGEPLIADFGLARMTGSDIDLTRSNQRLGTLPYMAPEQLSGGKSKLSPATDVWALGVMLYQLLTGERPFAGDSEDLIAGQIRSAEPLRPADRVASMDRTLDAIVMRCLEKDPEQRFPSAGALAQELGRWQRGEPTETLPEGPGLRAVRWVRRHARYVGIALGVVALATLGLAWPRSNPGEAEEQIEATLRKGAPAVLMADTGFPAWYEWLTGKETTQISTADDGTFSVHTWNCCLLELVRDPQWSSYRFRAEIHHQHRSEAAGVGLFFLHREYPTATRPIHSSARVLFDDIRGINEGFAGINPRTPVPVPDLNPVRLESLLYQDANPVATCDQSIGALSPRVFKPAGPANHVWRSVAVEVTPQTIRIFWDDQCVGEVARKALVEPARGQLAPFLHPGIEMPQTPEDDPTFPVRGSLGLCVVNGSAAYRNVVLEPLPAGQ